MYIQLTNLPKIRLEVENQDTCENERTPTFVRCSAVRLHTMIAAVQILLQLTATESSVKWFDSCRGGDKPDNTLQYNASLSTQMIIYTWLPSSVMTADQTVDHRLSSDEEHIHSTWNNSIEPVLTIKSGDTVRFECRDAVNNQITPKSTAQDVPKVNSDPVHPLTGPVAIEGAQPDDVVQVDLLDLSHKGWGFTSFLSGPEEQGLLPEEFDEPGLHIWELQDDIGYFVDDIQVPLDPFPGILGVAPAEDGDHSTIPPRSVGGNIDVKHLTEGSTLYLPVEVHDALFSIGDCHAAQGDGEVCVNGIEAPMSVTARFSIRPGMNIQQPRFETNGPFTPTGVDEPMFGTTGIDSDLMGATKNAVRHMIDHLHDNRELSRPEAYILTSSAVDLKINQVVDAPNWTVSAYLPKSLFRRE